MLKIHFGMLGTEVQQVSAFFDFEYEECWFEDPFVSQMVLDVDKTKVINSQNMISPVLGNINSSRISGGVKNLILAYKRNDLIIDASNCGDNCAKWFIEIGKMKDITITLSHIMTFYDDKTELDMPMSALILNTNEQIGTYRQYILKALELLR